ncbi:DUF2878 domain-containing protein [Microbulbifer taiwanensis]|uniref:DUF2878 domain-containing protein n=1 Tax=Microbulbifer taiwanensis TaxID=986746 RepID=A0ABW1YPK6_9GAMM|nr:DUF2878 domain-containing protein [Microbulbifer taiwanensis]
MKLVLNFSMYFCGWWIAILGGNAMALVALFVILVSHFALWRDQRDIFVVLFFIFAGFAMEWVYMASGVLDYGSNLPPAWVICMWAMLATTLRYSLSVLVGRPLLAFAAGLVLAPIVYTNSVYFGPADWGRTPWESMLILSVSWAPLAAVISGVVIPFIDQLDGGSESLEVCPIGFDHQPHRIE